MSRKIKSFCIIFLFIKTTFTVLSERTVGEIGNPLKDLDLCGRKGIRSNVCDPDGLVTVEQGIHFIRF